MTTRSIFAGVAVSAVLAGGATDGCTLFDDPPPQGGAAAGGAGGAGGAAPSSCTIDSPRCLLPELEAVRLCSLVAQCDELGASIALTTGLPLAVLDATGARTEFYFSDCVDWLTTPLEGAHAGFDGVRAAVNCMAATSTCAAASACLSFEVLAPDDDRCAAAPAGPSCVDGDLLDCDALQITRCDGLDFPAASQCDAGATGDVCRVTGCDGAGVTCATDNPPGVDYEVACTAGGDEVWTSCTAHGLGCANGIGCSGVEGTSAACNTPFEQTCADSSVVSTCTTQSPNALFAAQIDCSKIGLSCVEEGQAVRCASEDETCKPHDPDTNVCEPASTVLRLCLDGKPTTFDCGSIGLTCTPADADLPSARCALPP